ncbi:hypothetical protein [Cytophaga hutchinsonii]|jgi:hypothetical protein|uniref:Lipoprotein n=1 Tax=Cytophaga hutchinsonii (strain ATCC 33406 / DSM 1761 / CIP 103989 / NBRC 15051 / NCIMB 9469 / D465) TaxID=269798 RepID=A0A6N4SY39_CYTH3|nr:hypothetical protein [Cytophaga hutchinsonii]ABG61062.1 hypothetical protein CHU_3830 [Cytophaga hutchinsonii ATCC 33406]SFX45440.1 hypothetical protein SAMN04487930_104177 [Cytophaga hutchinsonii ATCC 33406]
MKRIYVILFTAALSASVFSCEKKADSNVHDKIENTEQDIKEKAADVKEDMKEETQKTTKNGSDAH